MKEKAIGSTRRQFLAETLALAGSPLLAAQKQYAPRIVCNTYYWVQLFSTPFRYILSQPDPLKAPAAGRQPARIQPTGGLVWTDEQWHRALSEVQYAGYRRMEMLSQTVMAKPIGDVQALLKQYGLIVNHLWHAGHSIPRRPQRRPLPPVSKPSIGRGLSNVRSSFLILSETGARCRMTMRGRRIGVWTALGGRLRIGG